MTPAQRFSSPKTKRRLSRSSNDKKLVLLLKGKIDSDKTPKFLRKKAEDNHNSKSIELWQKSAVIGQQKILKLIKGLEYLKYHFDKKTSRLKKSFQNSPNANSHSSFGQFMPKSIQDSKYQAIALLKSLVQNIVIIEDVQLDRNIERRSTQKLSIKHSRNQSKDDSPSQTLNDDSNNGQSQFKNQQYSFETDSGSNAFYENSNFSLRLHPGDDNHLSRLKKQDSQADSLPDNIRKNSKNESRNLGSEQDLLSIGRGRRRAVPLTEFDNFSESKVEESSFKFKLDSPCLRNAKDSLQMVFPVIAEEKEETSNTGSSSNLISNSIQKTHLPFAVTLQVPSNYDNKHKLSDETGATSPDKTTENHTNKTNITSDLELEDI